MSQAFHKWSHKSKTDNPAIVNKLQEIRLIINQETHAQHHITPFEGNYCFVSGFCNKILDDCGFFRRLEHLVWKYNGVESYAWKKDPELRERTLNGVYKPDTLESDKL